MFDLLLKMLSDAAALPLLMNYPRVIHAPALTQATLSLVTSQVRCLRSEKMSFFSANLSVPTVTMEMRFIYTRDLFYIL